MKKVAVLFHDGFEVLEALAVVDVMTRANVECKMIGMDDLEVTSSHQIKVKMDQIFNDDVINFDALVIPGGLPGATNLRDDNRVIEMVKKFNDAKKLVAAICAGPIVLEKAGVIASKKVTCFPGFDEQLTSAIYQNTLICQDENIITGRGPAAALAFSYAILEALGVDSSNIQDGMQYTFLKENI